MERLASQIQARSLAGLLVQRLGRGHLGRMSEAAAVPPGRNT